MQGLSEAEVRFGLAVAHDALGQSAKASNQVAAAIEALPEVSVSLMRRAIPYEDQEDKERWLATLTRLGLPME